MTPAPRDERGAAIERVFRCFAIDGVATRDIGEEEITAAQADLTALLSEADAARAKAIEDAAKALDEEASKLDMERKCGDWRLKDERRIRTEQAWYDARIVRALAAQDRAKENKNG